VFHSNSPPLKILCICWDSPSIQVMPLGAVLAVINFRYSSSPLGSCFLFKDRFVEATTGCHPRCFLLGFIILIDHNILGTSLFALSLEGDDLKLFESYVSHSHAPPPGPGFCLDESTPTFPVFWQKALLGHSSAPLYNIMDCLCKANPPPGQGSPFSFHRPSPVFGVFI